MVVDYSELLVEGQRGGDACGVRLSTGDPVSYRIAGSLWNHLADVLHGEYDADGPFHVTSCEDGGQSATSEFTDDHMKAIATTHGTFTWDPIDGDVFSWLSPGSDDRDEDYELTVSIDDGVRVIIASWPHGERASEQLVRDSHIPIGMSDEETANAIDDAVIQILAVVRASTSASVFDQRRQTDRPAQLT